MIAPAGFGATALYLSRRAPGVSLCEAGTIAARRDRGANPSAFRGNQSKSAIRGRRTSFRRVWQSILAAAVRGRSDRSAVHLRRRPSPGRLRLLAHQPLCPRDPHGSRADESGARERAQETGRQGPAARPQSGRVRRCEPLSGILRASEERWGGCKTRTNRRCAGIRGAESEWTQCQLSRLRGQTGVVQGPRPAAAATTPGHADSGPGTVSATAIVEVLKIARFPRKWIANVTLASFWTPVFFDFPRA
jgi:hypothetical protein